MPLPERLYCYCPRCKNMIFFPRGGGETTCDRCDIKFTMTPWEKDRDRIRIEYWLGPKAYQPWLRGR